MHLCFLLCMLCVRTLCKGCYKCHWLAFLSYREHYQAASIHEILALFIKRLCSVKYSDDGDECATYPEK